MDCHSAFGLQGIQIKDQPAEDTLIAVRIKKKAMHAYLYWMAAPSRWGPQLEGIRKMRSGESLYGLVVGAYH